MADDLIAGMPTLAVRYRAPAPDLRPYFSAYYLFVADLPHVSDTLRADQAQLRFLLAGRGGYGFADGTSTVSPAVTLLGPTFGATRLDIAGPALVLGVGLRAAGWAVLVGDDAARYADRAVDATAAVNPLLGDTLHALRSTAIPGRMADILESTLRLLVLRRTQARPWFADMADRWLTGSADPRIDRLVEEAELSTRQVERLTRQMYGAPPKLLARKYRALQVAARIGHGQLTSLSDAAEGFYDQSHFTREFKQFTGFTPGQFARAPSRMTVLTLQRNFLAGQPALVAVS